MDATSIKQLIQSMISPEMPAIVTGTVTGTEPLCITLLNDLNVRLSAVSLVIPSRLKPLALGEQFYMLSTNNNKTYYLLDRV